MPPPNSSLNSFLKFSLIWLNPSSNCFERGARVVDALLHVVALGGHLLVLRGKRLVFFQRVVVDRPEGIDLAL